MSRQASNTATRTAVASSDTAVQLAAPNSARRGLTIFNDSTAILHVGLGGTEVSTATFTNEMATETYWEIPEGFVGEVRGIWVAANGNAMVTELT